MDFLGTALGMMSRGAVLQIIPPQVPIKLSAWRAMLRRRTHEMIDNVGYPRPGEVKIDPTNSASMGVREEEVMDYVIQLNAGGIDVLVMKPQVWDDLGRALSFKEQWYRVAKAAGQGGGGPTAQASGGPTYGAPAPAPGAKNEGQGGP